MDNETSEITAELTGGTEVKPGRRLRRCGTRSPLIPFTLLLLQRRNKFWGFVPDVSEGTRDGPRGRNRG